MRKLRGSLVIATVSAGLMLGTQATFARAALDQTPPTLTVPARPAFVVGSVVDDYAIDSYWYSSNIAQLLKWSATDDVGVCGYDLFTVPAGSAPEAVLEFSQETHYTFMSGDYVDDFGGGQFHINGYLVTARDCTGNATTKAVTDLYLRVIQEDGISATLDQWVQPITYGGVWGQSNCACFLAEHTAFATKRGARATFSRTYTQGDQVALVMAEGPGRGKAGIRVDGKWVMTIDTFASVNTNRIVAFGQGMTAGLHTIAIVNQGTSGRPRIDLDAILLGTVDL